MWTIISLSIEIGCWKWGPNTYWFDNSQCKRIFKQANEGWYGILAILYKVLKKSGI